MDLYYTSCLLPEHELCCPDHVYRLSVAIDPIHDPWPFPRAKEHLQHKEFFVIKTTNIYFKQAEWQGLLNYYSVYLISDTTEFYRRVSARISYTDDYYPFVLVPREGFVIMWMNYFSFEPIKSCKRPSLTCKKNKNKCWMKNKS